MPICCCHNDDDVVADKQTEGKIQHSGLRRCTPPALIPQRVVEVPVRLNVYSLLEQNRTLGKLGLGVYHCGVVVYGFEWGYGETIDPTNASGLFHVCPGEAAGTLHRTLFLGVTTLSPQQVDTILHRLENEWRSEEYHILNHNCNHFAQRFCDLLSTTQKLKIPQWCNRAARVCSRIVPKRLASYVHRLIDEEPPKAPPPRCSKMGEIPESVIPRNWYLRPSLSQEPRYTATPTQDQQTLHHPVVPAPGTSFRDDACVVSGDTESYSLEKVVSDITDKSSGPLHGDPSCRGSLESRGGGVSTEPPLPLRHDIGEVVFFGCGSGSSPRNGMNSLFSPSYSNAMDESHSPHKGSLHLESFVSQFQSQCMPDSSSEAEHRDTVEQVFDDDDNDEENKNNIISSSKKAGEKATGSSGYIGVSIASVSLILEEEEEEEEEKEKRDDDGEEEKDGGVFKDQNKMDVVKKSPERNVGVGHDADALQLPLLIDSAITVSDVRVQILEEQQYDEEKKYEDVVTGEQSKNARSITLPPNQIAEVEKGKKEEETALHITNISSQVDNSEIVYRALDPLPQLTHTINPVFAWQAQLPQEKKTLEANDTATTLSKSENEMSNTGEVESDDNNTNTGKRSGFSTNLVSPANEDTKDTTVNAGEKKRHQRTERTPLEDSQTTAATPEDMFSDPDDSAEEKGAMSPDLFSTRSVLISPTPDKPKKSVDDWLLNPLQHLYENKQDLRRSWPL
ncbi:PPPDE putative peptidase domain [Trypanosoma melophagium]|uniref:PPPDE putative peptidase domain n=1 Tax=Trypanosoma melophagium TaxID=715481 RepID=UPI00351A0556|nr:PPPDE putative peptidase domain [Trypanosoma melophagium]